MESRNNYDSLLHLVKAYPWMHATHSDRGAPNQTKIYLEPRKKKRTKGLAEKDHYWRCSYDCTFANVTTLLRDSKQKIS